MSRLSDWISFTNFAGKRPGGQIATLIMVMIVAVLICALMIANLGHLSVRVARIENAADRTSLALGSQLATRATMLCKSLGDGKECITERCRPRGFLGPLLAIIAAVIVTILTHGAGAAWLASLFLPQAAVGAMSAAMVTAIGAAIAGAAAGAIGGGIAGTGALSGAVQGAITGFTMGYMSGSFGGVGGPGHSQIPSQLKFLSYQSLPKALGGAAMGAGAGIIGGPGLPGTVVGDKHSGDTLTVIGKQLSGLPDYERIRESTLHQALSDVIDDPNKTRNAATNPAGICYFPETGDVPQIINGDPMDVDGDDNVTESIPCFDHWWTVRVETLKEHLGLSAEGVVRHFIDGWDPSGASISLKQFRTETQNYLQGVERGDIEATCPPPPLTALTAGQAILLWNFLLENGYLQYRPMEPKFWEPGIPGKDALVSWLTCRGSTNCDAPAPDGFDSVDHSRLRYENFLVFATGIIWDPRVQPEDENAAGMTERDWIKGLADNYPEWGKQLYVEDAGDPAFSGSWHNQLSVVRDGSSESPPVIGLADWIGKTEEAWEKLPDCRIAWGTYTPKQSRTTSWDTPFCRHDLTNDPPQDPPIFPSTNADNMRFQIEGAHLQGGAWDPEKPECRATAIHKARLGEQLGRVGAFAGGLRNYIITNHLQRNPNPRPEHYDPVPMDCGGGCSAKIVGVDVVSIDKVCMPKTGLGAPDELTYAFTYKWECEICELNESKTPPTCDLCGSEWKEDEAEFTIATLNAPHVSIPCSERGVGPGQTDDAVGEFRGRVTALSQMVGRMNPPFGTIDADEDDEFKPVTDLRDGLIRKQFLATGKFLNRVADFHRRITAARVGARTPPAQDGSLPNFAQPINGRPIDGRYGWFDSLGHHEVTVEMGPWKLPATENKKCGTFLKGQTCLQMRDYCDGQPAADDNCKKPPAGRCRYKNPGDRGRTRITIRRNDPNNRELKIWTWNPFPSGIKKEAFSRYNVDTVGIDRVR